jgi:nucleotide-binding universal stress UspA family protein
MSRILCATNAGEDSRAVHIAAFRKAAESGSPLTFLHVIGGEDFYAQPERMREAIRLEMEWLLYAMVRVARDRAGAADVVSEVVIQTGDPRVEIIAYVKDSESSMLVIGVPREGQISLFHESSIEDFVAEIEALGVQVELVATADD